MVKRSGHARRPQGCLKLLTAAYANDALGTGRAEHFGSRRRERLVLLFGPSGGCAGQTPAMAEAHVLAAGHTRVAESAKRRIGYRDGIG
jgi:hypothetical protein